uniref:Myosin X n=1 Tax=Latimeria chalumnae TaxID=7897 RepID=H3B046_LATCH
VFTYKQSTLTRQKVTTMHPTSVEGVEDMATLSDLHEGSIMYNLFQRYQQDNIYTYIGSILASVNPYKSIPGLYDHNTVDLYSKHHLGEISPHLFAVANECYRCLWKRYDNQCVLISQKQREGKAECSLSIIFVSVIANNALSCSVIRRLSECIEKTVQHCSCIVNLLDQQKCLENHQWSYYRRFVVLSICIMGGDLNLTLNPLLDCSILLHRIIPKSYFALSELIAGAAKKKKKFKFNTLSSDHSKYAQLVQVLDRTLDRPKYTVPDSSFEIDFSHIHSKPHLVSFIYSYVLQASEAILIPACSSEVTFQNALLKSPIVAPLCSTELEDIFGGYSIVLHLYGIVKSKNISQAVDSRDSMAMALYSQCFAWIIRKINSRIRGKENFKSIGILDIFGFENFEVNRFEQFSINYANEKLQEYFNKHIFSLEQLEYNREGLMWQNIDWIDNGECLDLIEKKLGILALINEESHFPQATDSTLLEKLHSQHSNNSFYVKPRVAVHNFGLKHYAGEVLYDVRGTLEKNRDTFRDDLLNVLRESRLDFIYDLFEHVSSRNNQETLKCGSKHRKPTVSSQFKDSLHSLMATLSSSNPFFVRCIKPNMQKMPDQFDQTVVLNQLSYSGMLETVRIRRAGFPVRRPFQDFYIRYKVLMKSLPLSEDVKGKCAALLHLHDSTNTEWQLGKTKVFLRESLEHKLEKQREVEVHKAALIIQAYILGYMTRKKHYKKVLECVKVIQKNYRAFFWRKRFLYLRKAAITVQKQLRGQLARRAYKLLLEQKHREEEERQRQEAEILAQQVRFCKFTPSNLKYVTVKEAHKQQELVAMLEAQKELLLGKELEKQNESRQVEEILRLEREIQDLQRKKEQQELSLTESSLQRLQELRDEELKQLEEEACRAAQEFLESLNFDEIDECVRNIEKSLSVGGNYPEELNSLTVNASTEKPTFNFSQPYPEEEVDEGFDADDDAFKDSPNPSEHGHSDQRTSGIRTSDDSSEEDPYMNDTMIHNTSSTVSVMLLPAAQDLLSFNNSSNGDSTYCLPENATSVDLIPPDVDSDYDQDAYEDGAVTSGSSVFYSNSCSSPWSPDYRFSVGTYNSSGAYRFSSEGPQSSFEDSEDDFDSRFDTDDELSYRRDSVYSCVSLPYFHSFLHMKGGLMNTWKRRWCVLKDETFMWFRSKQEALKQGWLNKKGGGSSTLSRRNWKKRWFVLRQSKLMYFENDNEEKLKGTLDIRAAKEIIDNTGKENGLNIVMQDRTYNLIAESAEDASQWFSVLSQVHVSTEQEIREMHDEQANPQNAVGTLDVGLIDSVCASDNPDRPNSFVIITANRVLHCNADTPEEMHHWITLLQRSKGDSRVEGQEFIARGWLHKEVKNSSKTSVLKLKKRWFVLTHNSLDYYKSSEKNALKLGTLVLNSLCSVVQPDEKIFKETGYWNVMVYGRKHCYRLYTKLLNEATRWSSAIQNVIDTKAPIDTPTQQLIQDIKENCLNSEVVDQIYKRNLILRYTNHPLHSPLLPLPYGDINLNCNNYCPFQTCKSTLLQYFCSTEQMSSTT